MAIEDLKPIQRYELSVYESGMFGSSLDIEEDKDGEWCKWEDVEKVLDEVNKSLLEQIKSQLVVIDAKINRLD